MPPGSANRKNTAPAPRGDPVKKYTGFLCLLLCCAVFILPNTVDPLQKKLDEAAAAYKADPDNIDNIIWLGRRTAYTGRYREAVQVYTEGLKKFPDEPRLYRHRGHRYITLREFDLAINDFNEAVRLISGTEDRVEPDGMPNKMNIPLSTLHSNVWYHLGLAHYLKGDLEKALSAYKECMKVSKNGDMVTATANWLYMTYRLMGKEAETGKVLGRITKRLMIIENTAYYNLLLFYKGYFTEQMVLDGHGSSGKDPAVLYGLGNWYLYNGKKEEARKLFMKAIATGSKASFGYIAAEAHLKRM